MVSCRDGSSRTWCRLVSASKEAPADQSPVHPLFSLSSVLPNALTSGPPSLSHSHPAHSLLSEVFALGINLLCVHWNCEGFVYVVFSLSSSVPVFLHVSVAVRVFVPLSVSGSLCYIRAVRVCPPLVVRRNDEITFINIPGRRVWYCRRHFAPVGWRSHAGDPLRHGGFSAARIHLLLPETRLLFVIRRMIFIRGTDGVAPEGRGTGAI